MANTKSISDIAAISNAYPPAAGDVAELGNNLLPGESGGNTIRNKSVNQSKVDSSGLMALLNKNVKGEIRFDSGYRALYATDGSNYRQIPIGVVIPKDVDDVIATIEACRKFGAPLLCRGGGTSLAGQCCNVAVVLDFSKYMNKVLEIDPVRRLARIQPGCVLDDLRNAAKKHGLTFGPDPATHSHNTLGGMIGNDSCGSHSLLSQWEGDGLRTADNIHSLDVITYDGCRMSVGTTSEVDLKKIVDQGGRRGEIYTRLDELIGREADQIRNRFPHIPRRVSGYNLEYLLPEKKFNVARALVGSEGTLVTILEATVNLVPEPKVSSLVVFGFDDVFEAAEAAPYVTNTHKPSACEGIDDILVEYMKKKGLHPKDLKLLPEGKGWLITEFGGDTKAAADSAARAAIADMEHHAPKEIRPKSSKLYDDSAEEELVWRIRESGLGATADIPGLPSNWPGWEDSAVHPDKMGAYLRDLRKLMDSYDYRDVSFYGHFGQGCLHCRVPFDLKSAAGVAKFRSFMTDAARLVTSHGGSLSGEHGDGQARAELLPIMFGDEIVDAFREFKRIWDPDWKMNPGKVVDAYKIDENLRLGPDYNPWQPRTFFKYTSDDGSFANAALRCVGVGDCRRHEGGTMCPSFRATGEEMHSTRGRSRLLFEMLQGNPLKDKWKDESVKEALDLCLACKGCKGDCPVNVDMATYKAEFLSHYYENKPRPLTAFSFGWIPIWARYASKAPWLVNFFSQTPLLRTFARAAAGMDQRRRVPKFADQTFKEWFASRPSKQTGGQQVILWPDTFNNYFHPNTAIAATEVLESAGFEVIVPQQNICCGRPLYDYGFLEMAREWLIEILDTLRPWVQQGIPIVGLEPSCLSVFRDELPNLLPNDEDASRLSKQAFLLSEFLVKKAPHYKPPLLHRKAIIHGHCHHKALMKMTDEETLLKKMELECETPDTGCCGMAGAFGFESGDHYDVSIKVGEHVLLPKVRDAAKDVIIVADGFSCREQISQQTDRHGLHLAEVIKMGMVEGGAQQIATEYPENDFISQHVETQTNKAIAFLGLLALAGAGILWFLSIKSKRTEK